MTKQAYRKSQRVAPLGKDGAERIRRISQEHVAAKVNEVFVDAYSASAFTQVYDRVNQTNQARIEGLCVGEAMELVWRVVGRSREGAA